MESAGITHKRSYKADVKLIQENPYRLLGVYANSPTKERVANFNRIKAFLKVGREINLPLDLLYYLPALNRTEEMVKLAEANLTLPQDQLAYAQFWFIKETPLDEIAFNHLFAGNMANAMEIWNKKDNVSSLQNRFVISSINKDWKSAVRYAEVLYGNFTDAFIIKVVGNVTPVSTPLWQMLIDAFAESGVKIQQFADVVTNVAWKDYIAEKTINPLIDTIGNAINLAKSSKGKGSDARLKAGQRLMKSTTSALFQLNKLLSVSDIRYQTVVDKLATEILQCGIDYYNDSDEDDAPHKAMDLQSYALSIAVGSMVKQRCKENVDILKKTIDELPPLSVMAQYKVIKEELRKYNQLPDKICHAISLLNATQPHLNEIKSTIGLSNTVYLKLSTQVVNSALYSVIEEVNAVQRDETIEIEGREISIPLLLDRDVKIAQIRSVLKEAWAATKIMDTFDMEAEFKANRYNQNRSILKNMCEQLNISTSTYSPRQSVSQSCTTSVSSTSQATSFPTTNKTGNATTKSSDKSGCIIGVVCVAVGAIIGGVIAGGGGAIFGAVIVLSIYGKLVD